MNNYFFSNITVDDSNRRILKGLQDFANKNKRQAYVLSAPLTDSKYDYSYQKGFIYLSSKMKITFFTCEDLDSKDFEDYVEDVIEDIYSISDTYDYKKVLGRPRDWRKALTVCYSYDDDTNVKLLLDDLMLEDKSQQRRLDLLISLFIGSINKVTKDTLKEPANLLEEVKNKIQLFDGDQTRFIYDNRKIKGKRITIQGLSGTGKTELLLHKLKDLYTKEDSSRICFTCHNVILADNIRKRIPTFFDSMMVQQQIKWHSRLWCVNAWGKHGDINSGTYRYLCSFYNIPFFNFAEKKFDQACDDAFERIKKIPKTEFTHAFTYVFIDESQDFTESFFRLCELVTEKYVFIAGDIFQNIFEDHKAQTIRPNYLLSKCYRTDPKTLMFAHALGMGLFEKRKMWWIDKSEWEKCGYNVTEKQGCYELVREPIKRFEDLDDGNYPSLKIMTSSLLAKSAVELIAKLQQEYSTLIPDDIGIILLDEAKYIYPLIDDLERLIINKFGWQVNRAYESKQKQLGRVLISNRNNVKGLEFPFVICITRCINQTYTYRNTIYTMLTRSFLRSYLLVKEGDDSGLTPEILSGAKEIMETKKMVVTIPSASEQEEIRTRFEIEKQPLSLRERATEIMAKMQVGKKTSEKIFEMLKQADSDDDYSDEDSGALERLIKSYVDVFGK